MNITQSVGLASLIIEYWIGLTVIKSMRPVIRIGVNFKKMHKFNEILVNVSELLPFEHLSQVIWQWTCSSTQT